VIVDDATVLLFPFDEPIELNPADEMKNVNDPAGDPNGIPPLTVPTVVAGRVGRARQFGANVGLLATERVADSTKLTRDVTIECITALDAAKVTNGFHAILLRGKGKFFGDAETTLYGLGVLTTLGGAHVTLKMMWEEQGGFQFTDNGLDIPSRFLALPWVYLAAVRRWTAINSVAIDYYVNGELIGTTTTTHGDIGLGIGGHVVIGCVPLNATTYASFYIDALDALWVSSIARTAEQIRQRYLDIFERPATMYQLLRQLLPGGPYSDDPGSAIQRELAVEGTGLALALGLTAELSDDFLPDRATRSLARWESMLRISPSPADTIPTRRNRVLGFLRKTHGFSRDEIVKALGVTLGLAEADIEILERSNRYEQSVFPNDIADDLEWIGEPGAGLIGLNGAWRVLSIDDFVDARIAANFVRKGPMARIGIGNGTGAEWRAKVAALNINEDGEGGGLFFQRAGSADLHLFGVRQVAGVRRFFTKTIVEGVETETVYGAIAVPAMPVYLRMREDNGNVEVSYATVGFDGQNTAGYAWLVLGAVTGIGTPAWAGLFFMSGSANSAAGEINFADVRLWCPNEREVFEWLVFADPALTANPDLVGAQQQLDKMAPAHTIGTVARSKAFLADDDNSLCDRDPLGE
jgi:hypothetical protein